jgi:hypothetical protein
MQYLLLIFDNEQRWASYAPHEAQQIMGEYRLAQSGNYKGGNQLQPVASATTVRVRNGKRQTTDGPFAETREQLGGYFLIDAANLDEAIAIAERIPAAATGSIEVRPIVQQPSAVPA